MLLFFCTCFYWVLTIITSYFYHIPIIPSTIFINYFINFSIAIIFNTYWSMLVFSFNKISCMSNVYICNIIIFTKNFIYNCIWIINILFWHIKYFKTFLYSYPKIYKLLFLRYFGIFFRYFEILFYRNKLKIIFLVTRR